MDGAAGCVVVPAELAGELTDDEQAAAVVGGFAALAGVVDDGVGGGSLVGDGRRGATGSLERPRGDFDGQNRTPAAIGRAGG